MSTSSISSLNYNPIPLLNAPPANVEQAENVSKLESENSFIKLLPTTRIQIHPPSPFKRQKIDHATRQPDGLLPDDLWLEVINNLEMRDQASLCQVSRNLSEIAMKNFFNPVIYGTYANELAKSYCVAVTRSYEDLLDGELSYTDAFERSYYHDQMEELSHSSKIAKLFGGYVPYMALPLIPDSGQRRELEYRGVYVKPEEMTFPIMRMKDEGSRKAMVNFKFKTSEGVDRVFCICLWNIPFSNVKHWIQLYDNLSSDKKDNWPGLVHDDEHESGQFIIREEINMPFYDSLQSVIKNLFATHSIAWNAMNRQWEQAVPPIPHKPEAKPLDARQI